MLCCGPVMQDTLLPTAAYIGGPAEVAYMAQAQVVYQEILGRMPAILPRASFTVVEPPVANLLGKYELDIRDFFLRAAASAREDGGEISAAGPREPIRKG